MGLGVLVVATPISFIFINKLTNLQGDMLVHTDRRIALVNQLLAGMKSLKMYAWEAAQEARVRPSPRRSVLPRSLRCTYTPASHEKGSARGKRLQSSDPEAHASKAGSPQHVAVGHTEHFTKNLHACRSRRSARRR